MRGREREGGADEFGLVELVDGRLGFLLAGKLSSCMSACLGVGGGVPDRDCRLVSPVRKGGEREGGREGRGKGLLTESEASAPGRGRFPHDDGVDDRADRAEMLSSLFSSARLSLLLKGEVTSLSASSSVPIC